MCPLKDTAPEQRPSSSEHAGYQRSSALRVTPLEGEPLQLADDTYWHTSDVIVLRTAADLDHLEGGDIWSQHQTAPFSKLTRNTLAFSSLLLRVELGA
jgi:hypothetical protein